MASKYMPPHMRAAAAAPAPPTPAPAATQSHADWLRAQQSRYTHVIKTAEQLRAECAAMNFEQLKTRAGPPPNVRAEEFVWSAEGCAPDDTGGTDKTLFDSRLGAFKRGQGPPPGPLDHNQRDYEGCNKRVNAYCEWYSAWGEKLWRKWYEEHPMPLPKAKATPKPKPKTETTEPVVPRRVLEDVGDKSGW
jgi:hypothetical protein